jgi:hypothetical protein
MVGHVNMQSCDQNQAKRKLKTKWKHQRSNIRSLGVNAQLNFIYQLLDTCIVREGSSALFVFEISLELYFTV